MEDKFYSEHWLDQNGNPAGGMSSGKGFAISWQKGPLAIDGVRKEPNGAFVETIIKAAIDRLEFYQASKFNCLYNQNAITHLALALEYLNARTKDRENRKVEGTHSI